VILPALFAMAAVPATAAQPELKMVMADPRLPNKPTTHILDDRVSTGRIENFRELYVNPAQIGESLQPVGSLGPVGQMLSPADQRASIPVVNETSSYAEISINGIKIGVIDALQNGAIHDVPHGTYEITFGLQNGFEETRTIHTLHLEGAIIPGGKDVQAALESGYVPSWHATPNQGYVVLEPPAPKAPPKPRVRILGERVEIDEKVMFSLNSADIESASHGLLNEVAETLSGNPEVELIQIQGHTDAQGTDGANRRLSTQRAAAVKDFLVAAGIAEDRMQSIGFGAARPLVEGDTEEVYEANRRVEIHILQQRPKIVIEDPADEALEGTQEDSGDSEDAPGN
jgi:outer membrane protein OmpA-like peptidoglycan-associated protein